MWSDVNCVAEYCVPSLSLSDHFPIALTWNRELKEPSGGKENIIIYRDMKNFDYNLF